MQMLSALPFYCRSLLFSLSMGLLLLAAPACSDGDEPGVSTAPTGGIATATEAPEIAPTATESIPPAASPTPSPTPDPTPDEAAIAEAGYNGYQLFGDFQFAEPVDFPENVMMLVATGCTQCDSGPDALYRIWRNDGETSVDLLADASIAKDEDGDPRPGAEITSIAVRPTLHDIVITVCNECGDGPLTNSSTSVYRSIDGGMSWREILRNDPGEVVYARAITDEGIVLEDFGGGLRYLLGDTIDPPEGAEVLLPDSNRAGQLRWLGDDGSSVLNADGTPIVKVEPGSRVESFALDRRSGEVRVVGWGIGRVAGPFEGWAVTATGPDGTLRGFRHDTILSPVSVLADGAVLGRLSDESNPYGGLIGYIDASRGVLAPIHGALIEPPFGDDAGTSGERNDLLGATNGPFLRVTTGNNCLPIREATENQSRELTCADDGTLVYDLHNKITVGAQEWQRVRLLDGREGYTVSRYLSAG